MDTLVETKSDGQEAAPSEQQRPWSLSTPPPFPAIAMRVMEILGREDCELREVVDCIQSDPVFTAEILRVANSALYGFSHEIKSVQHATVTLGLDFIKALAVTVGMRAYVKSAMKIPVLRRCWRHSMACALLSQELASACWLKGDEAYTAGLLHDIGRMALLAAYPVEYANVLNVSIENSFDLLHCERELFDVDHCQAGTWLAKEWKLPSQISHVAAHHHDEIAQDASDLLSAVSLGCLMADTLEYGVIENRATLTFDEIRGRLPAKAQARFQPDPEKLKETLQEKMDALSLR